MDLRKQADGLGIPFTNDTTDDELRAMIAARNKAPAGLEPLDPQREVPECFGLLWAGDSDDGCESCEVEKHCLAKLADETIPRLNIEAGREMTPPELAEKLGLPISSISIALERRASRLKKAVEPATPPEPEKPKEERVKKAPKKKSEQAKPQDGSVTTTTSAADPQSAGSVSPVADPATAPAEKSVTPAAEQAPNEQSPIPGPSGKEKKAPNSAKQKNGNSTSSTTSGKEKPMSKPAKKAAPKKVAPKKSAPKKAAPKKVAPKKAAPKKAAPKKLPGQEPWGEHTFEARWTREREKSPLIAKCLPPGSKRTREFKGRQFELQTRQGYYLLNGEKHPTLYSTTMAITGGKSHAVFQKGKKVEGKTRQMSNWSGPKFWGLKQSE